MGLRDIAPYVNWVVKVHLFMVKFVDIVLRPGCMCSGGRFSIAVSDVMAGRRCPVHRRIAH